MSSFRGVLSCTPPSSWYLPHFLGLDHCSLFSTCCWIDFLGKFKLLFISQSSNPTSSIPLHSWSLPEATKPVCSLKWFPCVSCPFDPTVYEMGQYFPYPCLALGSYCRPLLWTANSTLDLPLPLASPSHFLAQDFFSIPSCKSTEKLVLAGLASGY